MSEKRMVEFKDFQVVEHEILDYEKSSRTISGPIPRSWTIIDLNLKVNNFFYQSVENKIYDFCSFICKKRFSIYRATTFYQNSKTDAIGMGQRYKIAFEDSNDALLFRLKGGNDYCQELDAEDFF